MAVMFDCLRVYWGQTTVIEKQRSITITDNAKRGIC